MFIPPWSQLRLWTLLGFLLLCIAYSTYQMTYSRNWGKALDVVIYPIAAQDNKATDKYIAGLSDRTFRSIDMWMAQQAKAHGLPNPAPIKTRMGEEITKLPPEFPAEPSPMKVLLWGLRMRWWSAMNTPDDPDLSWRSIKIYVVYHDGSPDTLSVPHSLGLQKGLIGLVHGYASRVQTAQNNVVIAHEMLHTVGATDKYNAYGSPVFPHGYANPNRSPLHPQRSAEIMAGRIPLSRYNSVMAFSLRSSKIGATTAEEINW